MSRRGSYIAEVPLQTGALHPEDSVIRRASVANPEFPDISRNAKDATEKEHKMSIMGAIKLYPKSIAWSMLLSSAIIMEGYDVVLLGSFYALPQFNQRYGEQLPDGTWTIPAPWKSGLSNGAQCGEIIGLFINGIVSEMFGYRRTMMVSLALMIAFIFIPFFAHNIQTLLVAEILCGIPWGVFQTLTTAYASEVCPVVLRPYLTTYVNLCWVIGQFIASGVLRGVLSREDQWAYRIPFAIQWVWPLPILIGVIFAPESPWWLVRKGREDDAKKSLLRLTSKKADPDFDVDDTVAMMAHTNEIEKQISAGTTYWDCFKGVDLRRTEIACITWLIQSCCGSGLMGLSSVFYVEAGLSTEGAFSLSMGQYALGMVGTIGSWFMMAFIGRRTIYLVGLQVLFVLLIVIGGISVAPSTTSTSWAIGSMMLVFTFVYDLSVGPVCYALVAEMSSTRLRAKTIVLARNLYNIGGIVNNVLLNYQLTAKPSGWGWSARSGFFWAGSCLLCIIWTYFRLPEPKGRTYGELDVLFERKVSARKFKGTKLDIFRSDHLAIVDSRDSMQKEKPSLSHEESV